MKTTKLFKICIGIILFLAVIGILCGVYAWYMFQNLDSMSSEQFPVPQLGTDTAKQEGTKPEIESATPETTGKAPVVIDLSKLTPAQQKTLSAFGYESDSLVLTEATIACAEAALGTTRLSEIVNGAAPNPLEAIKLAGCFKKNTL